MQGSRENGAVSGQVGTVAWFTFCVLSSVVPPLVCAQTAVTASDDGRYHPVASVCPLRAGSIPAAWPSSLGSQP